MLQFSHQNCTIQSTNESIVTLLVILLAIKIGLWFLKGSKGTQHNDNNWPSWCKRHPSRHFLSRETDQSLPPCTPDSHSPRCCEQPGPV